MIRTFVFVLGLTLLWAVTSATLEGKPVGAANKAIPGGNVEVSFAVTVTTLTVWSWVSITPCRVRTLAKRRTKTKVTQT